MHRFWICSFVFRSRMNLILQAWRKGQVVLQICKEATIKQNKNKVAFLGAELFLFFPPDIIRYAIKCGLLLLPLPRNNSGQAAAFFPPPLWPPPYLGVRSIPPPPPPREPKSEGTGREERGRAGDDSRLQLPRCNCLSHTPKQNSCFPLFWRHFLRGKKACLFLVSFFLLLHLWAPYKAKPS